MCIRDRLPAHEDHDRSYPGYDEYRYNLAEIGHNPYAVSYTHLDVYKRQGPDDQRDIFERLCDFYNGYDPSIGVQMTLSSSHKEMCIRDRSEGQSTGWNRFTA